MLIVPGMNYSLLLTRSIDFDVYAAVLYPSYPDELMRPLLLSLVQMLWDRGEPNGYAWHMTDDPYPNTPAHTVLLHEAFGDHQVANVTTEIEARTIGARLRQPGAGPRPQHRRRARSTASSRSASTRTAAARSWCGTSGRCVRPAASAPGRPTARARRPPPITNTAPRLARDPHGLTGREPAAQLQFAEFIRGAFIDTCGAMPCYAAGGRGRE